MSGRAKIVLIAGLLMLGAAALFLGRLQSFQKMGIPGIKVIAKPVHDPDGKIVGTNRVDLPETVLNYESRQMPIEPIVLNWLPKDTTFGQRLYRAPDGYETSLNVVLMGSDRTSIHKPICLTGAGWNIIDTEQTTIEIDAPHRYELPVVKLTLNREFARRDGVSEVRRGLYVYWFVADQQLSSDHLQRMWWMARDMIRLGVWQRWAYVANFAVCRPGQEDATYERMKKFIVAAVPEFQLATGAPVKLARRPEPK